MFLSLNPRLQFESKMKEMDKAQPPQSISEIRHLKSMAITALTPNKTSLATEIFNFSQNCPRLYKELLISTSDTSKIMRILSDSLAKNASIYKQLAVQYSFIQVTHYIYNMIIYRVQRWLTYSIP